MLQHVRHVAVDSDVRYEVAEWVYNRSGNLDFHVVYAKNRYSAPHRYVGRKVDLRVGESTLSIYHAGERIATHRRIRCSTASRLSV